MKSLIRFIIAGVLPLSVIVSYASTSTTPFCLSVLNNTGTAMHFQISQTNHNVPTITLQNDGNVPGNTGNTPVTVACGNVDNLPQANADIVGHFVGTPQRWPYTPLLSAVFRDGVVIGGSTSPGMGTLPNGVGFAIYPPFVAPAVFQVCNDSTGCP